MRKVLLHFKHAGKGQSFVELAVVLLFLLPLVLGMVEAGNLLNQYITVVDAAREGARLGSNGDPFTPPTDPDACTFEACIDEIIEGQDKQGGGSLAPVVLNPATDDVLISYFSIVGGTPAVRSAERFPQLGPREFWCSYCEYQDGAGLDANMHVSQFTKDQILAKINDYAPNTGVLLVEIYYNYPRLFKLPGFPDTIPLSTYAIMPLSAAEPTPVP